MPHDEFDIPPALADDLAELSDARVFVPADRDDAVLAEARRRLSDHDASVQRTELRITHWTQSHVTRGIAAALIVGVSVAFFFVTTRIQSRSALDPVTNRSPSPNAPLNADTATIPEDVDRSGRVDIVDAFIVAQQAERFLAPDPSFDFTSDGRVDRADAEHIARRAVALHNPGDAG